MNIIAVDDERSALISIERALKKVAPDASFTAFQFAKEALSFAKEQRVDVAFLDIEMTEMNGLIVAKHLKEINPHTNIIFVTGYSSYVVSAFELHASGYVMKPIRPERIALELENLRNPVKPTERGIRVQCFGNLAVYIDGKPLHFSRSKPKELFAYLIHKHGAPVTNAEIAAVLWEDEPYSRSVQSNTRNVISRLAKVLKDAGIGDILTKGRNSTSLDISRLSCDYYDYLRGDAAAVNSYMGEYLNEYSWAEFTVAYLNDKSNSQ